MAKSTEFIAQNYARLIKRGERTLDSISNTLVRQRVEEILKEENKG